MLLSSLIFYEQLQQDNDIPFYERNHTELYRLIKNNDIEAFKIYDKFCFTTNIIGVKCFNNCHKNYTYYKHFAKFVELIKVIGESKNNGQGDLQNNIIVKTHIKNRLNYLHINHPTSHCIYLLELLLMEELDNDDVKEMIIFLKKNTIIKFL